MIIEQNEYKVVKWGFNATTNNFPKSYLLSEKMSLEDTHPPTHPHTHTHIYIHTQSLQ